MPTQNLFRKLKQAIFPSRYILRALLDLDSKIASENSKVETRNKQMLALGYKFLMLQSSFYRWHLHHLENPAGVEAAELVIGYSLERIARKLKPKIIGDDFSKPILCMVCIGNDYAKTVEIGTRTKLDYCKLHGYNIAILEVAPYRFSRHSAWLRIPLIFHLMQMGYKNVFYLDADSLITNPKISLENFFDRLEKTGRHMMIAEDVYALNTGCFFMRKTWQSLTLLDLIYATNDDSSNGCWEQQALIDLIEQNPAVKLLLHIETEARLFNSMPFDRRPQGLPSDCSPYAWQPGDFICHFAGTRNQSELLSKMQKINDSGTACS